MRSLAEATNNLGDRIRQLLSAAVWSAARIPGFGLLDCIGYKDPFNDWGGRGCNKFVPVLGGNGTKIAPTGYITNFLVKYGEFGASLPTM